MESGRYVGRNGGAETAHSSPPRGNGGGGNVPGLAGDAPGVTPGTDEVVVALERVRLAEALGSPRGPFRAVHAPTMNARRTNARTPVDTAHYGTEHVPERR